MPKLRGLVRWMWAVLPTAMILGWFWYANVYNAPQNRAYRAFNHVAGNLQNRLEADTGIQPPQQPGVMDSAANAWHRYAVEVENMLHGSPVATQTADKSVAPTKRRNTATHLDAVQWKVKMFADYQRREHGLFSHESASEKASHLLSYMNYLGSKEKGAASSVNSALFRRLGNEASDASLRFRMSEKTEYPGLTKHQRALLALAYARMFDALFETPAPAAFNIPSMGKGE